MNLKSLTTDIKTWGKQLGLNQIGISDIYLPEHEAHLQRWLALKRHGEMGYMARYDHKRSRPEHLRPGVQRVICARMDYKPPAAESTQVLKKKNHAFISRYALGRDYHKLFRKRLAKLAKKIETQVADLDFRVFVDSAPVLEKALANKAGLGWIGKHSNLINRQAGSWFFLGEIYTNLPLPTDQAASAHCGSCNACLDICPTRAIVAPYQVDARLCISYLTIELKGAIPEHLRPLIGNRIYGCDDCQLICPWNKFAKNTGEADFHPRHQLDDIELISLFNWDEQQFLNNTAGSAIRRIGYLSWLRNIAVALGNAPYQAQIVQALEQRADHRAQMVREHVCWALLQQKAKQKAKAEKNASDKNSAR